MTQFEKAPKIVVIGAGPVGALAALYAARRGDRVEVYELRGGKQSFHSCDLYSDRPAKEHIQVFFVCITYIYSQIQEILRLYL